jgi:multidrug efflux pump subunit AcrB
MNRFDALVDACHKRSRPTIMTPIATGAGMLPLALGLSGDPSFRSPMAVAVIGGPITSTLPSLLVVPGGVCLCRRYRALAGEDREAIQEAAAACGAE